MEVTFSNLKIFRKQCGFTQEEIAEKLGVSRQAVAKWERGDTLPDIESCVKLADIYETTVDMLVRNVKAEEHTGDGKHIFGCTRLNGKGQITLPVNCRKVFGLKEGDNILVLGDEEKGIALVNLGSISGNISRIKDKINGED
ncbi:MAG: helix-turn-helix domain-containing protein [Ruminococcus flavefaciens]|nr:helix-turn-helix domain-containing protein [Ruminococcus flavefaciens]MCM1228545.1 helix-turn-helix domain-containing protein [Ruminococcus flavefaciens]